MDLIAARIVESKAYAPLLRFLHDSLVAFDPNYMQSVVRRFIETKQAENERDRWYRGIVTMQTDRGEQRTGLDAFDFAFLLQLFDFLARYENPEFRKTSWAPYLIDEYPLSKGVRKKITILKEKRNITAHESLESTRNGYLAILIGNMRDLFEHEIAVVVEKRPDVFSQETKDAVSDFVRFLETDAIDSIMEAIKRQETVIHEPEARVDPRLLASQVVEPLAVERLPQPHSTRVWLLPVGIGFVALLLWWLWPTKSVQQPARHYVVAVGVPSTANQAARFLRHVSRQGSAHAPVGLTVLTSSGDSVHVLVHPGMTKETRDRLANLLAAAPNVGTWDMFIRHYQRAIDASVQISRTHSPSIDSTNVHLVYLGPTPTKESWARFTSDSARAASVKFRPGSLERIEKHRIRSEFVVYDSISQDQARFIRERFYSKSNSVERSIITIQ